MIKNSLGKTWGTPYLYKEFTYSVVWKPNGVGSTLGAIQRLKCSRIDNVVTLFLEGDPSTAVAAGTTTNMTLVTPSGGAFTLDPLLIYNSTLGHIYVPTYAYIGGYNLCPVDIQNNGGILIYKDFSGTSFTGSCGTYSMTVSYVAGN